VNPGGTFSGRLVGWIVAPGMLAYPRGFRRRFGDEIRTDVRRALGTTGVRGACRQHQASGVRRGA
jgi:hypothetical protein